MYNNVEKYRQNAEAYQEPPIGALEKQIWLRIAEEWLKLAASEEERHRK
jgi:hypothetical protein